MPIDEQPLSSGIKGTFRLPFQADGLRAWAIRHKSGKYLLTRAKGRGKGYTHDEPETPGRRLPRLFASEKGAKLALKAWLAGAWVEKFSIDSNGNEDLGLDILPLPERNPEDMEIVPFLLIQERSHE